MHYLPAVRLARGEVRLPLCDPSAAELAQCWLADPPDRPHHAQHLLRREPVLAVWAFAQQFLNSPAAPAELHWRDLAEWLTTAAQHCWISEATQRNAAPAEPHLTADQRSHYIHLGELQLGELNETSASQLPQRLADASLQWFSLLTEPPAPASQDAGAAQVQPARSSVPTSSQPHNAAEQLANRWLASSLDEQHWLSLLAHRLALLQQLEQNFELAVRDEKLRALKEFAYGASHELNNPLANISTRAQTLLRDERDPERRRKLATINDQAFRAHEMISDLMLFAHPPRLEPEPFALTETIAAVVAELGPQALHQQTELQHFGADSPLPIVADRRHIAAAIKALVQNGVEAVATGGRVTVEARLIRNETIAAPREEIEIRVRDSGPGVPPSLRSCIFNPYYSGREAGRGLGLGLSKCWRIAMLHGGQLELGEAPSGAEFILRLPTKPQ